MSVELDGVWVELPRYKHRKIVAALEQLGIEKDYVKFSRTAVALKAMGVGDHGIVKEHMVELSERQKWCTDPRDYTTYTQALQKLGLDYVNPSDERKKEVKQRLLEYADKGEWVFFVWLAQAMRDIGIDDDGIVEKNRLKAVEGLRVAASGEWTVFIHQAADMKRLGLADNNMIKRFRKWILDKTNSKYSAGEHAKYIRLMADLAELSLLTPTQKKGGLFNQ